MQEKNGGKKKGIKFFERTLDTVAAQAGTFGCPRKKSGCKVRLAFQGKPGESGVTGDGPAMGSGYNQQAFKQGVDIVMRDACRNVLRGAGFFRNYLFALQYSPRGSTSLVEWALAYRASLMGKTIQICINV
jgi:hypothetical protein